MNGFSNRATWLINLHFNPKSKNDVLSIKDYVEEKINGLDDWLIDLINDEINCNELEINWDELLKHCDGEE